MRPNCIWVRRADGSYRHGEERHHRAQDCRNLESTGTPAMFMHPVEAVHGDLGMLVRGDVVVALSAERRDGRDPATAGDHQAAAACP